MSKENQKLKLLYLADILMEKTDENHFLTANQLCEELAKYDVPAERKVIYKDLELLRDVYGMDIIKGEKRNSGYGLAGRNFELAELKLLVDAVQSSRFITAKKSEQLIKKLEKLTSKYEAQKLQRQVFIYNRVKTENETIFYHVDMIHEAISANVRIRFKYVEWNREKKSVYRKNGEDYQISPWCLTWDNQSYYLIGHEESSGKIKHFRVDKMRQMKLTKLPRLGQELFQAFDLAAFSKKTFRMFGGKDARVTLRCQNYLAGVILDRFGVDVMMIPEGENEFRTRFDVAVSSQFFGWLAGLGNGVEILDPWEIKEEYRQYLENILKLYQ